MNKNWPVPFEGDESHFLYQLVRRSIAVCLAVLVLLAAQTDVLHAQEPAAEEKKTEEKKAEAAPKEEAAADAAKAAETTTAVPNTINRDKVAPDEEGRIQFNYVGQPWLQVLQDFADAAGYSLDWQELPPDTLNLTTQRSYTPKEAHDLMNRHLLARGFTMLVEGEVLSIVKVDKLDPSLVPRAEPDDLEDYAPHDFMRVTFDLPLTMDPAKAAEDVKILLSPNAKVTALLASRRLLVIDAVINLRDVRSLMYAEQKEEKDAGQPREFVLKYHRADYVAEQVLVVLGLDPNVIKTPDELKLETQRIQMQMELIKKASDVSKMIKSDGPKVYIAVNRRRNSILVNAPAELMLLVVRTVKQIDVAPEKGADGEMALTLKQYQLVTADPRDITKSLEDIGQMDPRSRLQFDRSAKTIRATATATDHEKILAIIKQLDVTLPAIIEAEALDAQQSHDFVRVLFQMPFGMSPSEMASKVQPLLGANAKVLSLPTSRELMIVDTVETLLAARELIDGELKAFAAKDTPQDFVMQHRQAEEVAGRVFSMLGLSPAGLANPQGTQLSYQGMSLFVTVNTKSNSFRVNAHPDLLMLIEGTIKRFDVPESEASADAVPQSLKQYRITGQNISSVIKMMREFGGVSPLARLQVATAPETLFAIASDEDHDKISKFLEEFGFAKIKMVGADQLGEYEADDFVRIRFQLPLGISSSDVIAKVRPFLSSKAVVKPLPTLRQLMIDDTVENLLEASEVIAAELAAFAAKDTPQEFVMQHRRAEEVAGRVLTLLGLSPAGLTNPQGTQLSYQGMSLFVTVNTKSNSFRVNAHPELLKLIEGTVKQFDIPEPAAAEGDMPAQTMVLYKVVGQDLTALIVMLREVGGVGPLARMQTGPAAETLYAIAGEEDHGKIQSFLDTIAPKTIKTVEAASLESLPAQDLVRVRFQLPLSASVAIVAAELRSMSTARGIVQSLESSKQIIVLDTAENLINIREVINAEIAALETQSVVKEFPLQHRSASEMVEQVLAMLGFDPATVSSPYQLRMELQAMKLFITANQQRNSLMVNAAPDKLKLIAEIVEQLDVPQTVASEGDADRLSMVPYKVMGQNVTVVVKALQDIGSLSPRARLQADPSYQTLYAYANQADHETIRKFVDKIDPSSIRRVVADKLEEYSSQERVRVRFQLPVTADVSLAATQIRGVLGAAGQVQMLAASKQLIVDGTVANLIEVRDLLIAENEALTAVDVFREFRIQHRRAEKMVAQVLTMLELSPTSLASPQGARFDYRGMKLFISINPDRNAIVVGAREELVKMVERIIQQFDVPEAESAVEGAEALSMKMVKVPGQNVAAVIAMLDKLAELGPLARIDVGPAAETLYAIASSEDHEKIRIFLEKITPRPVQTVAADELENLPPDELVRVRFEVPGSASVATLAVQLQGIVAPPGLVHYLESSKQIIVTDTAKNLINIREILAAESVALEAKSNIQEFSLKHRRAEEMVEQVLAMLGFDPATVSSPYQLRVELQAIQLFITANQERNSLIVNAGADKLKLVEQIVQQLDVPQSEGEVEESDRLTLVPYDLEFIDMASAKKALTEIAGLSPRARLEGQPAGRKLFAYATRDDHAKITTFLQKTRPKSKRIYRIEPEMLEQYSDDDHGRVRFQLPLTADVAQSAAQIKGILGREGIVQALMSSKQLVVVDSVETLLEVRDILKAEAAAQKVENNIREFQLEHRRADEMVEQVLAMLGFDPATVSSPYQLRQELQAMKLFVTANQQRNSLLVKAEPAKMEIVEKIVKQLDVPQEVQSAGAAENADKQYMVPYKVAGQNVNSLVTALNELGKLGPLTRLKGDPVSLTLYAYASKADHAKILEFVTQGDPNHIHQIEADQLEEYPAGDRARVVFQLPPKANMQELALQIQGIVAPTGRAQALDSSKQLVVVDTVGNLIGVREIIIAEAAAMTSQDAIREFPLKHRRAEEMVDQVLSMMGINPDIRISNHQLFQQELRKLKLFITVNPQRNSLMVNAPADKMSEVEQIVSRLDVSKNGQPEIEIATTMQTMVSYKLAAGDVNSAIKALLEVGGLEPRTRLQPGPINNTIYALASKADHQRIRKFVDEMDPNIVRRVHPDELEDNPGYEVVRAIFQLPLSSDIGLAADQIKGVLGLKARVQSLDSSKQLVVVDTVANLIDVRDLLYGEQLAAKALEMPMVFPLKHRRASYVADQVMILLGLDPSARKTSVELQFEAQRMQMMQQPGQPSGKMGDQTVYIAVNRRQNSLLVNTPPEKAPLIERTIEQIDVPVENGHSEAMGQLTMEKYQTVTADTDSIIGALEELGNLDPKTQLQSDSTGKVIYAYATVADHATIKKMIARLDGTGRRPEVRWLPAHLPADQMAGTIMALIVPPEKKKENNLPWYYYRNRDDDKEDERNDGFRAMPDVENNRLLLWATEAELEEVDNLIEKLSERSDGTFNDRRKVRRLELRDPEATLKLLEQLRATWSGKNKLEIAPPPGEAKPEVGSEKPKEKEEDKVTGVIKFSPGFASQPTWLAQVVAEPDEAEVVEAESQIEVETIANEEIEAAPPIMIAINEAGEIILSSEDTEALDRLQLLIEQLSPVQTEFKSFQLYYISVIDLVYNLENYFEDEMAAGDGEQILDWWGRQQQKTPEPKPLTLGKRPPIRFIDDIKTNTLLVANASSSQLRVVEEMIELYDQPPNPELYYQRRTEAVKIKYSRANDIANSLKEVYRDLLSSKDKEFRTEEGKSSVALSRESSYVFGDARDVIDGVESPVLVRFSGALAIGVDEMSNSVVISAREAVLEEIKDTIHKLDRAAMPRTVVRVHSANGVLDADRLRAIIAETLSDPWVGGQPAGGGNSKSKKSRKSSRRSKSKSSSK